MRKQSFPVYKIIKFVSKLLIFFQIYDLLKQHKVSHDKMNLNTYLYFQTMFLAIIPL